MKQLGNKPEGSLDELMKKAIDDPMIDAVINPGSHRSWDESLNLIPTFYSNKILQGIERHIGFCKKDEYKLAYHAEDLPRFYTFDNALLAVAYLGEGKKNEAEQIVASIENVVGFENNLVRTCFEEPYPRHANYALAIAYGVLGQRDKAYKIFENINQPLDSDTDTREIDVWKELALKGLSWISNGMGKKAADESEKLWSHIKHIPVNENSTTAALVGAFQYALYSVPHQPIEMIKDFTKDVEFEEVKEAGLAKPLNTTYNAALAIAYQAEAFYRKYLK